MFKPINYKLLAFYVTANHFPVELVYMFNVFFHLPGGHSFWLILVHYGLLLAGSIYSLGKKNVTVHTPRHKYNIFCCFIVAC